MPEAPLIAITLGDPAGIGPEVVAKALSAPPGFPARAVVVGSASVLDRALHLIGSPLKAQSIPDPLSSAPEGSIAVFGDDAPDLDALPYGVASPAAGGAAVRWAMSAAQLAMDGHVQAVVTAPLNKEAAHMAGYEELGHQEIYQAMTDSPEVVTMLVTTGLRVVHLTTHRSLRLACDYVTRENVLAKIKLTNAFFTSHGYERPRIAAAALNPHGGEAGLIGNEEIEAISPAVDDARGLGIDVSGPIPADTVFNQAIEGRFDVVLAMYHDQGHIAIKVHDWAASTTMNLGLPFLRTSVDHGTAYDIAGRGVADPTGMVQAIHLAARLASTGRLNDG
ncbi:MAG: 4-hydroxythreonine-4-phosphate dehydrogenase PdxA [Dehalococcoidia bacterium]